MFSEYARFYDALYRDKDYGRECDYLEKIFGKYSRRPVRKVLDLGCGTGGHALILSRRGYDVTGVDASASMLSGARAKARREERPPRFRKGDIRKIRLKERFDAVVSMFAVMGYQVGEGDAERAVATASRHLKRGGLFAFDAWFGPAVLRTPPGERNKEVEGPEGKIVRTTRCRLDLLRQVVTVSFRTSLHRGKRIGEVVEEDHPMRFFFPRELSLLLRGGGFSLRLLAPFMSLRGRPDEESWNVMVVAEKTAVPSRR